MVLGMKMLVGYARVSTLDQNPQLQIDALKQAGCERLYVEKASGAHRDRPELKAALEYMRPGDTLVVWRLSRLARSLKQIIETAHELEQKKQALKVLTRNIDTGTPEGRLFFHITAAFDEFQRELIVENTKAGLAAARKRGRKGGRPPAMDKEKIRLADERRPRAVSPYVPLSKSATPAKPGELSILSDATDRSIEMFAALGAVAFGSPARATELYSMSGAYCAAGGREGELVRPVVRSAPCVPPRAPLALSGAPVSAGLRCPSISQGLASASIRTSRPNSLKTARLHLRVVDLATRPSTVTPSARLTLCVLPE
jgi:DNA invertase Pin-like site-specific DNA recombinase